MDDDQILQRPIGWWLKEADARIEAAFASALGEQGVNRRAWQVLTTLARSPSGRSGLAAALASFDEPGALDGVVAELRRRGWVEEVDGVLRLTPAGRGAQDELAKRADNVRQQVSAALPADDYLALVRLLARLVAGLPAPPGSGGSRWAGPTSG